jgi:hypothetical protein
MFAAIWYAFMQFSLPHLTEAQGGVSSYCHLSFFLALRSLASADIVSLYRIHICKPFLISPLYIYRLNAYS